MLGLTLIIHIFIDLLVTGWLISGALGGIQVIQVSGFMPVIVLNAQSSRVRLA